MLPFFAFLYHLIFVIVVIGISCKIGHVAINGYRMNMWLERMCRLACEKKEGVVFLFLLCLFAPAVFVGL